MKKIKSKEIKQKDIMKLTPTELMELARLSSSVHKKYPDELYKYLGLKYQYRSLNVPKEWRKKELNTAFHVVSMPAKKEDRKNFGQLDRIFVVDYKLRNVFRLFNVMPDKTLTEVELWQDDLFQMHKYLIQRGYDIQDARS